MHFNRIRFIALFAAAFMSIEASGQANFDGTSMKVNAEHLKEISSFRYPLDDYFPENPVTLTVPPKGERYHTAEDSYSPEGTPVYAIGDGTISYSGRARGYGWLIIIDHPVEDVYSLYGHLSTSRWKKSPGEVKKGELIAYLAEAAEGETNASHIHFGLRMGQKADYPQIGDARWMAGYTYIHPELHGWFQPSKIIGETDSMRIWHRSIRKREDIVTGSTLQASDFRITSGKYSEKEDLDKIISKEFGDDYRLANWQDIKAVKTDMEAWADSIGFLEGEKNSLFISNEGYRIWLRRQYYISRFNHNKPADYLAFKTIDDNYICLGSWFGISMHILAVRK